MNDWIVASINNPDFTPTDFHNIADMDINNTQLKSREFYLKSNYIRNNDLFKDAEGNFSESLFNKYYDSRLNSFLEFLAGEFHGLELDMFDTNQTKDSKIRDNGFEIGRIISNPDRLKIGVEGINTWSDPEKSRSEIAQMNKIWDYEKQEFRDYSPNDTALFNGKKDYGTGWFKSLWDDPLVVALWEEDGTHIDPITGQEIKHKKGDYKLNDKGTYYYETLGGRSTVGKNVLSALDTLTVDGTGINKYDFFDSDDIEKSVGGVIAKNVATLAPIFTPIGGIYSTALIAKEMAKSLPMLYGVATALFGDFETPKWMNTVAALGEKFTGGTSDYAKQHTFSVENLGNMIADVSLQWGQLKQIAKVFDSLRGIKNNYMDDVMKNAEALYNVKKTQMPGVDPLALMNACIKKFLPQAEKAALKAGQLGRDMSLVYMAIISNSDVYNDMLEHGASRREAAAVALGSTLGMFAVDKTGIGEAFFDDATDETTKAVRAALKKEMRDANNTIFKLEAAKGGNVLLGYINKAAEVSKRFFNDYADDIKNHTLTALLKMGAEGVEEVSEELVSDTFKAMYELAGKFGANTTVKDVGAWDNAWDRYSMSFLGGALGGGIFYGKEVWDGRTYKQDKSNEELATLIRNGHTDDVRSMILDMKKKGKFGNTKLSGKRHEFTDSNKPVWLTAENREESQNDVIANLINDKVNAIDAVINNNQIGLNDDLLFTLMVLGESRYNKYKDIAHVTNYYLDFNNVINNLITAELNLKAAEKTLTGTVDGILITSDLDLRAMTDEKKAARALNLQTFLNKLEEARKAKDEFLSGDTSLDYTRKLNFAIDPNLHEAFLPIDEHQMWESKFKDRNPEDITLEEYSKFMSEVQDAKQTYLKNNLSESWNRFKNIEKVVAPELTSLAQMTPEFKKWHSKFMNSVLPKLSKAAENYNKQLFNWNMLLPEESQEEFDSRDTLGKIQELQPESGEIFEREETQNEFVARKNARAAKIKKLNELLYLDCANTVKEELRAVNYQIDPLVHKELLGPNGLVSARIKDVFDVNKGNATDALVLQSLTSLKYDLSNTDEVILDMTERKTKAVKLKVDKLLEDILNTTITYENGVSELMRDYAVGQSDPMENGFNLNLLYTILDFIDGSADPEFNEATKIKLSSLFTELKSLIGDKVYGDSIILENLTPENWLYVLSDSVIVSNMENATKESINLGKNQIQAIIQDILNNPIYKLREELKTTVKNPVVEVVKSFAGKVIDSQTMPEIETFLNSAQDIYEGADTVEDWVLDEAQMKAMDTTENLLKLINTYLYAASSKATLLTGVGHNKVMNEYAKNHSDVISAWDELPEIDADYAMLYLSQMQKYADIFKHWKEFSNLHQINKKNQFLKSDKAFNKALWGMLQEKMDDGAFKVNVDDKEYNLLEGLDANAVQNDLVQRYNVEKTLYKNFQNALSDSKLSTYEFLEKSKILDSLISNNFGNQDISKFDDKVQKDTLTSFDKYLYLSMILTLDPAKFYLELKDRTKGNTDIAPISVLEYSARLSKAATNLLFRDFMRYGHVKSGDIKAGMYNTAIISGVAGAGKTKVAVKGATSLYSPEQLWALGPTDKLAKSLRDSINAGTKTTIEDALEKIIGKDSLLKLKNALDSVKIDRDGNLTSDKTDFFNIAVNDGFVYAKLNPDSIKFTDTIEAPKMIVIDEATHTNSLYAQIFDLYMRQNNGTLLLVGDPNQRGYSNKNNLLGNIEELDVFAARTPKLTVSLRDNNIQKLYNLGVVESLLNILLDKHKTLNQLQWQEYWQTAKNIMLSFNFKVFNKNEINGDAIVPELTSNLIDKIKGKTIGYIGDKTSATYLKLLDAGLEEGKDFTALTLDEMQGLEFDHVVIDYTFGEITLPLTFLKDLYTLMSRGRESAIFIDHDLSSKIGQNKISEYLAKAPSLLESVDGQSPVDQLRQEKIELLDLFDLSPVELKNPPVEEKTKPETPKNPEEDFVDPDLKHLDEDLKEKLESEVTEEIGESQVTPDTPVELNEETTENIIRELVNVEDISDINSEFTIPSWGEVTYLGVQEEDIIVLENGEDVNRKKWTISRPTNGPLRNLLALYADGTSAITRDEKLEKLKTLNILKSAILFNHSHFDENDNTEYEPFPREIRTNFSKEDWNKGKFLLEIRSVDGEVKPIFGKMPEIGMDYKGKKYIANIVFSVKNRGRNGQEGQECRFDVAGINNPETLIKNLTTIKQNITDKLAKDAQRPENQRRYSAAKISQLENIRDTIDAQATKYATKFDEWINTFNNEGAFELDISDAIDFNKTTWLQRRLTPIRLGGLINPEEKILNASEYESLSKEELDAYNKKRIRNLKTLNPNLVFSKIYTYSSKDEEIGSIDLGLKGKAVVFVTSDMMAKPDQLVHMYMSQKSDPAHNTPAVRMLVLNNYGMTFSQFHQPEFIRNFQGGDSDRKPLRLNFNGIGMFTGLWNWRAGLLKFNEALSAWKGNHNYDDTKLNNILKAALEIYDKGDIDTILTRYNVSLEDIDNLNKFNSEDLKDLPIFRLGYTKNGNGFHVQQYQLNGSTAYKGQSVAQLLAITPEKAAQFYELTNDILNGIVPISTLTNSLEVKLLKEDGTDWKPEEFIDLDKAAHRRTLSRLLHVDNNYKLIISDGSLNLAYARGEEWSMIPAFLSHIVRKTTALLLEDPNAFDEWEMANIKHSRDDNKKASVQIGKWIKSGTLKSNPDGVKKLQDTSLLDMLDLVFHGTIEDIHKGSPLRLDDARFKYGFLVNPDAKYVLDLGKYKVVSILGEKGSVFIEIDTSDALFTADVEVRSAGIGLNLDKLLGSSRTPKHVVEQKDNDEDIKARLAHYLQAILNADNATELNRIKELAESYLNSINVENFAEDIQNIEDAIKAKTFNTFSESYPNGAKLIEQLNNTLDEEDLFDMTYEGLQKAVYANNKKLIPLAVRDFQVNPDTDRTGLFILHEGQDALAVTLQGYVESLLPAGESAKLEVDEDSLLVVNNKYKLVINLDIINLLEIQVKPSPEDKLDEILNPSTNEKLHENIDVVKDSLNAIYNDPKVMEEYRRTAGNILNIINDKEKTNPLKDYDIQQIIEKNVDFTGYLVTLDDMLEALGVLLDITERCNK